MRFTPMSESEADTAAAGLWEDGPYDFEIREAEEKPSNKGNDMFALSLYIHGQDGTRKVVFDYIVMSESFAWKLRHFAAATGLLQQYERGNLMANEMVGRTGRCQIGTQPAKDGYPAKNVVRDYIKADIRPAAPSPRKPVPAGRGSDLDDEVPF